MQIIQFRDLSHIEKEKESSERPWEVFGRKSPRQRSQEAEEAKKEISKYGKAYME